MRHRQQVIVVLTKEIYRQHSKLRGPKDNSVPQANWVPPGRYLGTGSFVTVFLDLVLGGEDDGGINVVSMLGGSEAGLMI